MILIDIMQVYKYIIHMHVIQVKTEYTYSSLEENKDGCQWPVMSYLGLSISSCAWWNSAEVCLCKYCGSHFGS